MKSNFGINFWKKNVTQEPGRLLAIAITTKPAALQGKQIQ